MVTFTNSCHMLSCTYNPLSMLPYFWPKVHICHDLWNDPHNSYSAGQEIPCFCETQQFITVFIRVFCWSPSWTKWMHFTSLHSISLRSMCTLS